MFFYVKRLMFQIFKLRADSHLKSENYFKFDLVSNAKKLSILVAWTETVAGHEHRTASSRFLTQK